MEKDKKVSAFVSDDCFQELVLLKGYMRISAMPDVVKHVLEKNVSQMLSKVANKHLKGISVSNEE